MCGEQSLGAPAEVLIESAQLEHAVGRIGWGDRRRGPPGGGEGLAGGDEHPGPAGVHEGELPEIEGDVVVAGLDRGGRTRRQPGIAGVGVLQLAVGTPMTSVAPSTLTSSQNGTSPALNRTPPASRSHEYVNPRPAGLKARSMYQVQRRRQARCVADRGHYRDGPRGPPLLHRQGSDWLPYPQRQSAMTDLSASQVPGFVTPADRPDQRRRRPGRRTPQGRRRRLRPAGQLRWGQHHDHRGGPSNHSGVHG